MCNGCKYFFEDMSCNATDCAKQDIMTFEEFEKYFGNDQNGCPYREEIEFCPICGNKFIGYPALSRRDNKTKICSNCGVQEALEDFCNAISREHYEEEKER